MLHDFTSARRVPVTLRHRSARRHNPGRITWFIANAVKRFAEGKPHCPARGRGSRAYYATRKQDQRVHRSRIGAPSVERTSFLTPATRSILATNRLKFSRQILVVLRQHISQNTDPALAQSVREPTMDPGMGRLAR